MGVFVNIWLLWPCRVNFEYDTIEIEEYINDNSIGAVKSIKYDNIDDFDDVQADDDFFNFNNKKEKT